MHRRPYFYGRDGSRLGHYFLSMDMRKMSHCLATTCDELMKNEERLQPNDRRAARININGHPYQQCCSSNAHNRSTWGKIYRKFTFGVGIEDNSATREQVAVFTLIDAPIALVRASPSYVRDRRRTTTHTARKIRPSTNAMVGDVAVLNL